MCFLTLQHNECCLKSSVCFSAWCSKCIPVSNKIKKKRFFVCSYFLPSCMKNSCFARCIFTGQEWQGEVVFLRHFDPCQLLVLAPYSQFISVWYSQLSLGTSTWVHPPPEHLCPSGKTGQQAGWQRRVGLWRT